MLDIKFIRENIDIVKSGAKKKNIEIDLDELLKIDDERKEMLQKVEAGRVKQNATSEQIVRGVSDTERNALVENMKLIKEQMKKDEEKLREVMEVWQS